MSLIAVLIEDIDEVLQLCSAIADLVGWVEVTKPNIALISYLNLLGFTLFNPTYILLHTNITIKDQPF